MSELDAMRYIRLANLVSEGELILSYPSLTEGKYIIGAEEHFLTDKEEMDAYLDAMGKYE